MFFVYLIKGILKDIPKYILLKLGLLDLFLKVIKE